jgi:pimeloyl-ACP methyl ester carboxylesterase
VTAFADRTWRSRDGLSLYARDYAAQSGPARLPVVCLHGLTRNSADFDELAPWIASRSRRVLALDVRGRGRSQPAPDPARYQLDVYANDVQSLARALGIGRAVFIGTSMGGLITMTLGMHRLPLIAAAVLNDVGPVMSQRGLDRIRGYAGRCQVLSSWDDAAGYLREINCVAFPGNSDDDWHKWARRAFAEDDGGRLVPRYDPNIATPLHTGAIRASSWASQVAFRRLANNRPTLLVRGELSDLVETEQRDLMQRQAPSLRYAEVPGVGHAPMLTEPEALSALERFLDEVD